MSADEQWGLRDVAMPPWAHNRDSILEHLKGKLAKCSPLKYLETKYPTPESKADYARILWQLLPPLNDDCLFWDLENLPGKSPTTVTAQDVHIVHIATLSFLEASMVCVPSVEKCLKLADEILTDGFITETEPLILNAKVDVGDHAAPGIPPWGETVNGKHTLRPFSLCHHKSAARVVTLHLLLNVFMEEAQ